MAKSIRSKVKRKFRSVKRQKILAKKISALQAETVKEEMNVQPDTVDGNESLPVITSKSSEESTSQDNASHSSPNSHESKEVTISNTQMKRYRAKIKREKAKYKKKWSKRGTRKSKRG